MVRCDPHFSSFEGPQTRHLLFAWPKHGGGFEGSYGHEQQDATIYASSAMDYLKYDLCSYMSNMGLHDPRQDPQKAVAMMKTAYAKMHQALVSTHRPIV